MDEYKTNETGSAVIKDAGGGERDVTIKIKRKYVRVFVVAMLMIFSYILGGMSATARTRYRQSKQQYFPVKPSINIELPDNARDVIEKFIQKRGR